MIMAKQEDSLVNKIRAPQVEPPNSVEVYPLAAILTHAIRGERKREAEVELQCM